MKKYILSQIICQDTNYCQWVDIMSSLSVQDCRNAARILMLKDNIKLGLREVIETEIPLLGANK